MKDAIDNFSGGAADYATFRPGSPADVFDFLYGHIRNFDAAWDCGTGNGQVAATLADRFGTVYGTDISSQQLALAEQRPNIIYRRERAEQTTIPGSSIDLITIAQAIHWFDFDQFYKEVRRVGRPGAVIAAWTYTVLRVTPEVDEVIRHLYMDVTAPFWDRERALVDAAYSTIPFPFEDIPTPVFGIHRQYTLPQLMGYLRTWSGVRHYMEQTNSDPLLLVAADMERAWGNEELREVRWPVHMRAGRL